MCEKDSFIRSILTRPIKVLKSGGYKVSALDVEREILEHPKVAEAIVVGLEDAEFGQRIAAAVVLHEVCLPHSPFLPFTSDVYEPEKGCERFC